jgi:hypothetical protein
MQWKLWKSAPQPGSAATPTSEAPAPSTVSSAPTSLSTFTAALADMEAEATTTPSVSSTSTTSAESTSTSSESNMGWMTNLQLIAEQPYEQLANLALTALPDTLRARLEILAEGTGQPAHVVVHEIAVWFAEEEDAHCEGPLIDGITFYLEQLC